MSDQLAEEHSPTMDRRRLVKKLAVGAFAIPVVVSFKLDSLARAGDFSYGNGTFPDHSYGNGTNPGQPFPNFLIRLLRLIFGH